MAIKQSIKSQLYTITVLVIILVGFWLRLIYALTHEFHPDEYISLLASRGILEKGIPILPSGLFYNSELLFSYLNSVFLWLLGPIELSGRFTALFFSLLTIPMAYLVGKRIFSSSLVGVGVAFIFAFAPETLVWGTRVRRYSLAEFLVLLMLLLVWLGFIKQSRKYRFWFYLVYLLSGLTSLLSLVILPPLTLAVIIFTWQKFIKKLKSISFYKTGAIEIILFTLASLIIILNMRYDFVAVLVATNSTENKAQTLQNSLSVSTILNSTEPFLSPDIDFAYELKKIETLANDEPLYQVLVISALLTIFSTFLIRQKAFGNSRQSIWFIGIITIGVVVEFLIFVSEDWKSSRYLLIPLFPPLTLLACGFLGCCERLKLQTGKTKIYLSGIPLLIFYFASLYFILPEIITDLQESISKNAYYRVFQFLKEHTDSTDRVMVTTTMPAISYWYLDRTDYYLRNGNPYVFINNQQKHVDPWVGAEWIFDTEGVSQAFDRDHNLWIVVDQDHFNKKFSFALKQQILSRTDTVFRADDLTVFRSATEPIVIPVEPTVQVNAIFGERVKLIGYTWDDELAQKEQPSELTLFWKIIKPVSKDYKVFVYLYSTNNQVIIQASDPPTELLELFQNHKFSIDEIIPDVRYLNIPSDLPTGTYSLSVSINNPATSDSLSMQSENSTEDTIILDTFQIP